MDDCDVVNAQVYGKVTALQHNLRPCAITGIYQADGPHTYPIQGPEQGCDKFDLRGLFEADGLVRYCYATVLAKPCTVPYNSAVGELLRAGNRHACSPAYLYYNEKKPKITAITTVVCFENMEHVDNDAAFAVCKSLLAKIRPVASVTSDLPATKTPDTVVELNFVLAPEG